MLNDLTGVVLAFFAVGLVLIICTIATAMATHRANDYHAAILKELRKANGTLPPDPQVLDRLPELAVLSRTCPSCGARYSGDVTICPRDNSQLV